MSEEFSTLSIVNHYQDGKLTGYSVSGEKFVSLSEEEPLEIPEIFPTKQQIKDKEDALRSVVRFPDEND